MHSFFSFHCRHLGLHISIRKAQFHHSIFYFESKNFFFHGYESAQLNGFSIFLFKKRECAPPPARVTSESVIPSERSVGTHQIASVAPNPNGITCVCPLCSVLQQHLALVSPLVLLLWRQVLCDKFSQAPFIKLRAALMWFVLHFLAFFLFWTVQLGQTQGRFRWAWWGLRAKVMGEKEKGTGLPCHLLVFFHRVLVWNLNDPLFSALC